MCHNQWIPACSQQSPAQPLGDVCSAGAKETSHRLCLCPLLCWAHFYLPEHIWSLAVPHAHIPLKSARITVKSDHRLFVSPSCWSRVRSCCIFGTLCVSSSTGRALAAGFHAARRMWCFLPASGSLLGLHPGKMSSKLWGTLPCSLALLADVTSGLRDAPKSHQTTPSDPTMLLEMEICSCNPPGFQGCVPGEACAAWRGWDKELCPISQPQERDVATVRSPLCQGWGGFQCHQST